MSTSNPKLDAVDEADDYSRAGRSDRRSLQTGSTSRIPQRRKDRPISNQHLKPPPLAPSSHQRSRSMENQLRVEQRTTLYRDHVDPIILQQAGERYYPEGDRIVVQRLLSEAEIHTLEAATANLHARNEYNLFSDAADPLHSSGAIRDRAWDLNLAQQFQDRSSSPYSVVYTNVSSPTGRDGNESPSSYIHGRDASQTGAISPRTDDAVAQEQNDILDLAVEEQTHILSELSTTVIEDWRTVQEQLPEEWKWDVEYRHQYAQSEEFHRSWTCTPSQLACPKNYPLKIAGAPVVIPVEHRWPPLAGLKPPPDPRPHPHQRFDCREKLTEDTVRDLFNVFQGSIGFYVLINGLIQVIMPQGFDIEMASLHMPSKYGGMRVCYIPQTMEPTFDLRPSKSKSKGKGTTKSPSSPVPTLHLNDTIEARTKPGKVKDKKFEGQIGLSVCKRNKSYLIMSSHVITESLRAKPRRSHPVELKEGWKDQVEIWAGDKPIGSVYHSWDKTPAKYPEGFEHDVSLIHVENQDLIKDVVSPVPDLHWLTAQSWAALRREASPDLKILSSVPSRQAAKTIKSEGPSNVQIVGQGIFLNRKATENGARKGLHNGQMIWENFVSQALLYRVNPDFDQPYGHSGVALYADGWREDGKYGPGVVGFQSFVQRSGHTQSFNMDGDAFDRYMEKGRVAFYGAFQVPEKLRQEWRIVCEQGT